MTLRWLAAAVLSAGLVAGCGTHSTSGSSNSSTSSEGLVHGSPLAAVPGADKAAMKAVVDQCAPVAASGTAQLKWATDIVNDDHVHPNGSRSRLTSCTGIPAAKRPAAEGALLTDVEHVRWDKTTARQQFWDITLPGWVMTWRSA